jgi:hypothetical protein
MNVVFADSKPEIPSGLPALYRMTLASFAWTPAEDIGCIE